MPSTKQPNSIANALADASARLATISDSARLEAEILVARSIDMPRSYLFAHPEDLLDTRALERLHATVEQRCAGTPLAYITGSREFWSLELFVTPATLVPRPETELLVDLALREIPRRADWQILDLGTGSGAIAVAIAKERPLCEVTAVDSSADALNVARQNVRQLKLPNVTCLEGNWTEPVAGQRFHVILSNPPYVAEGDPHLDALAGEPGMALTAGADGLDAIRLLAAECPDIIEVDGFLLLEHGNEQHDAVTAILESAGWRDIAGYDDYAGNPRVVTARPGNQQS